MERGNGRIFCQGEPGESSGASRPGNPGSDTTQGIAPVAAGQSKPKTQQSFAPVISHPTRCRHFDSGFAMNCSPLAVR